MTATIRAPKTITTAKLTGAHFTPPALADFVAARLLRAAGTDLLNVGMEVLDPSCGDGELLRAFIDAVPEFHRPLHTLVGVENNAEALQRTRERLQVRGTENDLLEADFLDISDAFSEPANLGPLFFEAREDFPIRRPDAIIANPPYVRTQVLGAARAQELATRFGLSGRVDLYAAFLVAMTLVLKDGGLLAVITSNRFLSTRSGESVRHFLSENYDIVEIIDLGDTKLFSAAVLPAIMIARKRSATGAPTTTEPRFLRIYEVNSNESAEATDVASASVYAALAEERNATFAIDGKRYALTAGALVVGATPREPWRMASAAETAWTETIERHATMRVADFAKVRVGIKTTADSIYIKSDWGAMPEDQRPEDDLLRPIFTHFDAAKWKANKRPGPQLNVLYTHTTENGKRRPIDIAKYPLAAKYFETKRDELEARTYVLDAGRKWFEIWVPQDPLAWELPKLIFPDISSEPRFFFDDSGTLVNGDCYWIPMNETDVNVLYVIAATANSKVMSRYHDLAFNNKLYSGRRRYISQYVEEYPIPDPRSEIGLELGRLVLELLGAQRPEDRERLEALVEARVTHAFGIGA